MKKKKFTILIAAAMLCSSGGVAWGQMVQDPQQYVNLRSNESQEYVLDWSGPAAGTASSQLCEGTWTLGSGFAIQNNFGPGETGFLRPSVSPTSNIRGIWSTTNGGAGTDLNTITPSDGIITVGGTKNVVVTKWNQQSITGTTFTTSMGASDGTNTGHDYIADDGTTDRQSSIGPGTIKLSRPGVPDDSGEGNTAGTYSIGETSITLTPGPITAPDFAWNLQILQFMQNPWYMDEYKLETVNVSHTLSYWSYYDDNNCGSSGTDPCHSPYWHHLTQTGTHDEVKYTYTAPVQKDDLDARIVVSAGSHIHLKGSSNVSIQANGSLGSTTAYLDLPSAGDYYSIMNDAEVKLANITYTSALAPSAVWGINKQIDQPLTSNAAGGAFLIGSATNVGSQGQLTVTAPTAANNGKWWQGNGAHTDMADPNLRHCLPLLTAANVGNYGKNDVTLLAASMLPATLSNGKFQIYSHDNTAGNLTFGVGYAPTMGTGALLIEASKVLTFNSGSALNVTGGAGHATLSAGDVAFNENETLTNGAAGDYGVYAWASDKTGPKLTAPTWVGLCSPCFDWCSSGYLLNEQAAFQNTTCPFPGPGYAGFTLGADEGSNECVVYTGTGNITLADGKNTEWTLGAGEARWQANNDIKTGADSKETWTGGAGNALWLAKKDILFGTGNELKWTSAAAGNMSLQAGGKIETNNLKSKVELTGAGNASWMANGDILAGNGTNKLALTEWKTSAGGNLLWQAGNNIDVVSGAVIKFDLASGAGSARWQAKKNIGVNAGAAINFTNTASSGTMIWQAEEGTIATIGGSTGAITFLNTPANGGLMAWQAGTDIHTNNKIAFTNTASVNNMEWVACQDILTNYGATTADASGDFAVTFTNAVASKGDMLWHAGRNINTRSKTEFINNGAGNMVWLAKGDILTELGKTSPQNTLGDGIKFSQSATGKGRSLWYADGSIETNNTVHFDWSACTTDTASINFYAGKHITIGKTFNATDTTVNQFKIQTKANDTIGFHSKDEYILTNSLVNIIRINPASGYNYLWAGCQGYTEDNNIRIENAFKYTESSGQNTGGKSLVHWYAENDIRSNWECDNDRPAPITFKVGAASKTHTIWEAERNINTRGRVDYAYAGATAMGDLEWLSRGGYIMTERPVTVKFDSDSLISFRAENARHDAMRGGTANADASGLRGNIHTFDSIDIVRKNAVGGLTEFKAENHIWTAMLNYEDKISTADSMDIISHMGDIYLGYNDGTNNRPSAWNYWVGNQNATAPYGENQQNPTMSCLYPAANPVSYDLNRFTYKVPASNVDGHLWIKAGWDEKTDRTQVAGFDAGAGHDRGGNIYFTHVDINEGNGSKHATEISVPFTSQWICGRDGELWNRAGDSWKFYEQSGIIAGVSKLASSLDHVSGQTAKYPTSNNTQASDTGLIYTGFDGDLLVDAGLRGNIIFNNGAYLTNQDAGIGNSMFITRDGDIDMRDSFNVEGVQGKLMFLASSEVPNKWKITNAEKSFCTCEEMRNNIYLQDFDYKAPTTNGSVYIGADNNIKLNYAGLTNRGTKQDPFLSMPWEAMGSTENGKQIGYGYSYGHDGWGTLDTLQYHCDLRASENQARMLNFDWSTATVGGGLAIVASDKIDIYQDFNYRGSMNGGAMGAAPTTTGQLQGENVSGYGLYMVTLGNKDNYTMNILKGERPTCPTGCGTENCKEAYLHNTVRMTFHDNAHILAGNQKVYIASPVIEAFDTLELRADSVGMTPTPNGFMTVKVDSLIVHGLLDWNLKSSQFKLTTWSGLHRDEPILKLGYNRNKPPMNEYAYNDGTNTVLCRECVVDDLDTTYVKFGDGATLDRLNVTVADHTVLTFSTDSFDHQLLSGVQNARIYTDTFKIRNQVKMWSDPTHIYDGKLELISEEQMFSKSYAGIYTKHLHMEPIGACDHPTSELWQLEDRALDVITTSTFGGFGILYNDVHVENEGFLAPGFASLGMAGNCYEQHAGTLTMDDLRLDGGAIINVTVGDGTPGPDGYLDMVNVKGNLTTYGNAYIHIKLRPCQHLPEMCGSINPVLKYNTATPGSLNNIFLIVDMPDKNSKAYTDYKDDWDALSKMTLNMTTEGEIYICENADAPIIVNRQINMPSVAGVTTNPPAGIHYIQTGNNFNFTATYTDKPFVVKTDRYFDGVQEELVGTKNANGEYEYTIRRVTTGPVNIFFGPEYVANASVDEGTAVWSHNNTIYVKVDRADIASIYSIAGQLVKRIEVPEGDTSIPMERGVYVVTLKDGSVHKVIVK